MDEFTQAYITCALWSSTDSDDTPMDSNYTMLDIAPKTLADMIDDCNRFQTENVEQLYYCYQYHEYGPSQAGHDFWLTRNHHGAGFWDRGLGTVGEQLTQAAHAAEEVNLYVGDDFKVYAD